MLQLVWPWSLTSLMDNSQRESEAIMKVRAVPVIPSNVGSAEDEVRLKRSFS